MGFREGLGLRVQDLECKVHGLGFRTKRLWLRVQELEFMVEDFELMVKGPWLRILTEDGDGRAAIRREDPGHNVQHLVWGIWFKVGGL